MFLDNFEPIGAIQNGKEEAFATLMRKYRRSLSEKQRQVFCCDSTAS
jgi:hypothetical protein